MQRHATKRAPFPPCPPDLAPSDYCHFGRVKQLLRGREFTDQKAFFHAIEDLLGIEKVVLKDVFLSWMERLHQYGNAAGKYVE
jgi:hypothetical protein